MCDDIKNFAIEIRCITFSRYSYNYVVEDSKFACSIWFILLTKSRTLTNDYVFAEGTIVFVICPLAVVPCKTLDIQFHFDILKSHTCTPAKVWILY